MPDLNWHSIFFLLFAIMTCGFAVAVVVTSNIVRMAFYLTLSLGATAGLFILAGAEFVGAMQLMIYVGGTLVLLVFGVMLTAQQRFIEMKTSGGDWVLAIISGGALMALLAICSFSAGEWSQPHPDPESVTVADSRVTTQIGAALIGVRTDAVNETDEQVKRGMSGYLLMFEIVAIHLLVVLVGAAYLARTKKLAGAKQP